jgi:hypothetical protein
VKRWAKPAEPGRFQSGLGREELPIEDKVGAVRFFLSRPGWEKAVHLTLAAKPAMRARLDRHTVIDVHRRALSKSAVAVLRMAVMV